MIIKLSRKVGKIPAMFACAPRRFSIRQKIYDYCRVHHKDPVMLFYDDILEKPFEKRMPANVIYNNPFIRFFPSFRIWLKYASVIMTGALFSSYWLISGLYFTMLIPIFFAMPLPEEEDFLVRNITVDPDTLEFKITYGDDKEVKAFFEDVSVARVFRPLFDSLKVPGVSQELLVSNFLFHQFNEEAFIELHLKNIEKFADIVNVIDQELIDVEQWQQEVDKAIQEQEEK